jgi:hypothetical protein
VTKKKTSSRVLPEPGAVILTFSGVFGKSTGFNHRKNTPAIPLGIPLPCSGSAFQVRSDALSENPQKVKVELGLKKKNIRFPFWLPIPIYSQQKTQ